DKPIFFVQSKNDKKSTPHITQDLYNILKKKKGQVSLDRLRDGAKGVLEFNDEKIHYKMSSEPESMRKIFDFFYSVRDRRPNPRKKYSTYAVYRDTVYGVFIEEKKTSGMASFEYSVRGNTLDIKTSNIKKFSFDNS